MLASYHKYTDTKIISRPGRFVKGFAKSRTDALDATQPAVALPSKNTLLYLPRILVIIDADPDLKTTSEVTTMTLGERIKELRKKNDLTQEKLADFLCVSYQAVSKWECGLSSPDLSLIVPLSRLFHVTTDELLGVIPEEADNRYAQLKKEYDATIMKVLMDVRLERAEEHLRKSRISLKEIADGCGFSDQNYFSKAFAAKYGCSPSEYRKKMYKK
jgi:AraC-like DNA-binding protein